MTKDNLDLLNRAINDGVILQFANWDNDPFLFKNGEWFFTSGTKLTPAFAAGLFKHDLKEYKPPKVKKKYYQRVICDDLQACFHFYDDNNDVYRGKSVYEIKVEPETNRLYIEVESEGDNDHR